MSLRNPPTRLADQPGLNPEIESVIERSRTQLELSESDDCAPVSPATWKRAATFLRTQASACNALFQVDLPVPEINPADAGSIDLFWQLEQHRLLINFPAEPFEPVTYYGQTIAGDQTIAGRTTVQDERLDLIAWLIRKKA